MLARSLLVIAGAAGFSATLCGLGVLVAFFLQGPSIALALLRAWVYDFNGVLVGGVGLGLLWLVQTDGRSLLARLLTVIEVPPTLAPALLREVHRAHSWRWIAIVSLPLTLLGGTLLWACGFPLSGFAHYYLGIFTTSVYAIGATILAFYLLTMNIFRFLEENAHGTSCIRLRPNVTAFELEHLDLFFILTSALGLLSIYLGFRGTLTASFLQRPPILQKLLVLPVLLFLPATLYYSFYPRYVLRRLLDLDTLQSVSTLQALAEAQRPANLKEDLELRKLVIELKERMVADRQASPLLTLKDAPSLTLGLLVLLQFLLQRDSVVEDFFRQLMK